MNFVNKIIMKLTKHRTHHDKLKESDENFIRQDAKRLYAILIKLKGYEFLSSDFGGHKIRIYPATSNKQLVNKFELNYKRHYGNDISQIDFIKLVELENILVFNAQIYAQNQMDWIIKHFDNVSIFIDSFDVKKLPANY